MRTGLSVPVVSCLILSACRSPAPFNRILTAGQWPAFGYLAAEAELARASAPAQPVDP